MLQRIDEGLTGPKHMMLETHIGPDGYDSRTFVINRPTHPHGGQKKK